MADLGSSLASILQVPGLQELLNQSITENRQVAPLRTAVQQQALNMLPNSAFSRPNVSAIPPANYSTPAPSGGTDWAKVLSILAAGLAGGGALAKLFGGGGAPGANGAQSGGNLANIANALKKLFGGGGSSFSGPGPAKGGYQFPGSTGEPPTGLGGNPGPYAGGYNFPFDMSEPPLSLSNDYPSGPQPSPFDGLPGGIDLPGGGEPTRSDSWESGDE
jgi:hypothetical protein